MILRNSNKDEIINNDLSGGYYEQYYLRIRSRVHQRSKRGSADPRIAGVSRFRQEYLHGQTQRQEF